ncbi:MAG: bacillithiol biosynthesis deacetylase BshB1 [Bacteroidota bacterium]
MKLDILAIGAHPDDVELGAGATLAKEIEAGKKVGILDLTRGELGTRGSAEIRDVESQKSAEVLGIQVRENLLLEDGFFENTKENQLKIVEVIRKYRPEVVLINAIDDRHPDHPKASQLASASCFLSGLVKVKTYRDNKEQEKWKPKHVYSYIQWKYLDPDFVVDVSEFMDKKMQAIQQYKSQFFDPNSKEPETPISGKQFLDGLKHIASELGRVSGVKYAEGFKVERYPVVDSFFDLK